MFCEKCGMKLEEEWSACPACGYRINHAEITDERHVERDIQMEITAGELTVSGQRRLASDVHIYGNQVMIKSYRNTKGYSTPEINEFSIDHISQIQHKKHPCIRTKHKTTYALGVVFFVLGLISTELYYSLFGLVIIGVNYWNSLWKAMEISISDGRKIYIYYSDEDDAVQIEHELKRKV